MTRLELITLVGERLGDTSTGFLADLNGLFDLVLDEMASHEAIRSLYKQFDDFQFSADTRSYSTQDLTGLTEPNFPLDIYRIVVPEWGLEGILERIDDERFEKLRVVNTNSDGTPRTYRPRYWRLWPNEQQIQFEPVPRVDEEPAIVEVTYLSPPSILEDGDDITEIRAEHIPVIIAGMIKHGLVYQDATIIDRPTAIREFELGIARMKGQMWRERGRDRRTRYVDF